jgi:hypothetical protein
MTMNDGRISNGEIEMTKPGPLNIREARLHHDQIRRLARSRPAGRTADEPEPLWDTQQVAVAMGKQEKTVRQMVWRRQIPFLKINRSIRFRPSVIRSLLEAAEVPVRETR